MQKFWIPKIHIPENYQIKNNDYCMEISIPDNCQHCNEKLIINRNGGKNHNSNFLNCCEHFIQYSLIWENRITEIVFAKLDINDGMKCSGVCGLWSYMSEPNQPDNTFKCYSCRNRGW